MPVGVITFFNDHKGYGFIEGENKDNLYVHHTSIRHPGYRTLKEGQEVWFDVRRGQHGLEAVNVHKI